jgi:hypothetical protein
MKTTEDTATVSSIVVLNYLYCSGVADIGQLVTPLRAPPSTLCHVTRSLARTTPLQSMMGWKPSLKHPDHQRVIHNVVIDIVFR